MLRVVATLLALALLLAPSSQTYAQQPPPPLPSRPAPQPPQNGDILWTFSQAQASPFSDSRVSLAIATLMDAKVRTGGARVFYAELRGPDVLAYVNQSPAPVDQVPLLLAVAGFPGGLGALTETGRCKVWISPSPSAGDARPTADALGPALQSALASQGKTVQACALTDQPADADLYVWVAGSPPPLQIQRQQGFLSLPGPPPPPIPTFKPPTTGSAGLWVSP